MYKGKRKLKYVCVAIIVTLLMMMQTVSGQFINALTTTTSDLNMDVFHPKVNLKKDANGQALKNNDVIHMGDTLYLHLDFNLASTDITDIDINQKYTISIPDYLQIKDSMEIQVALEGDLGPLGTLTLEKGVDSTAGTAVFQYDKNVQDYDNIENANLYFEVALNKDKVGEQENIVIPLQKEANLTLRIFDNIPVASSIKKTGSFNKNSGTIEWTVQLTPQHPAMKYPKLVDELGPDQNYVPNTFKIKTVDKDYTNVTPVLDANNVLTYDISVDDFMGEVSVQYQTIPNGNFLYEGNKLLNKGSQTVKNKATLYDGDIANTVTVSKQVTASLDGSWLVKSSQLSSDRKSIDWTLELNNVQQPLTNVKLYDLLPSGLTLDKNSITVDNVPVHANALGTGSGYTFSYTYARLDNTSIIKYKTNIDNEILVSNNKVDFNNKAWIEVNWDPGDGAKDFSLPEITKSHAFTPALVTKKALGYDASTQEISWLIAVNNDNADLGAIQNTLTEEIGKNQVYVQNSLIASDAKGNATAATHNEVFVHATQPSVKFDNVQTDTIYYTLKTRVTNSDFFANNKEATYSNKVVLKHDKLDKAASASTTIKSEVIQKTAQDYDYNNAVQNWSVTVNKNGMLIKKAVLSDVLDKGQTYVDNSLTVKDKAGNNVDVNRYNFTYDDTTRTMRLNLRDDTNKDEITQIYKLTYQTKIDTNVAFDKKNNDKQQLLNSMTLAMQDYDSVTSQASKIVPNHVIDKNSAYTKGNLYIDYTVKINQNKQSFDDGVIMDTLSEGLQIDLTSIKLYKANINKDGGFVQGDEVLRGEDTHSYKRDYKSQENGTSILNIQLPSDASMKQQAYILKYSADINNLSSGMKKYLNSIRFNGNDNPSDSQNNVEVSVAGGGGGGTASKSRILTLTNTDKVSTDLKLKDASFGLYLVDGKDEILVTKGTTSAKGTIVFRGISFDGTYKIKQLNAAAGYQKSEEVITIDKEGSGSEKNITKTFTNEKNKGVISFHTVGTNDELDMQKNHDLAGSTYTLYHDKECKQPVKDDTNKAVQATSNESGLVTFVAVSHDTYYVKTTDIPSNYVKNSEVFVAKLNQDGEFTKLEDTKGQVVDSIVQEALRGTITINSKDKETKEQVTGVTFGIYKNKETTPFKTAKTDEKGLAVFDKLLMDKKYSIKVMNTLTTLKLSKEEISKTLVSNEKDMVSTVLHEPTYITFKKTNGDKEVLKDAEFSITEKDKDTIIGKQKSDKDGNVKFTHLDKTRKYTIKETQAPDGYLLNTQSFEAFFDTNENGILQNQKKEQITEIINAEKGSIQLVLTDKEDKDIVLSDATYLVKNKDGKVLQTKTTDKNGTISFNDLALGTYTIVEKIPADGYVQVKEPLIVTLKKGTTQHQLLELSNEPTKITFKKEGESEELNGNTTPLEGVKFALYDEKDKDFTNPLATAESDKLGTVSFSKVKRGNYIVRVIETTPYHKLNETLYYTEIGTDGRFVSLVDESGKKHNVIYAKAIRGDITLIKTNVKNDSHKLKGATYALYREDQEDDKAIMELTSNDSGELIFKDLLLNVPYYVKETKAADGFQLAKEKITFKVDVDKNNKDGYTLVLDGKIQKEPVIQGKGVPTKVSIKNTDEKENVLVGTKLQILDKAEKPITDIWTSTLDEHVVEGKLIAGETYTIVPVEASKGYILAKPVPFTVTAKEVALDEDIQDKLTISSEPTQLDISKYSSFDKKELKDSKLQVLVANSDGTVIKDEDGNVKIAKTKDDEILEWVSGETSKHIIGLPQGHYVVREIGAVAGYITSRDINITIQQDGTVLQSDKPVDDALVVMDTDTTKVDFIAIDKDDKKVLTEVPLRIKDDKGEVVIDFTSTKEPHVLEKVLVAGAKYTVEEVQTPKGYQSIQLITFTVHTDGKKQSVVMEYEKEKKSEIEVNDNSNKDNNQNTDTSTDNTNKDSLKKQDKHTIDTGDHNQNQVYMFALILSSSALLSLLYVLKKRFKKS